MKQSQIKEFSTVELGEKLKSEKSALVKLKMNHAISPAENPMKIKVARKNIARLSTEITARANSENTKK